MQVKRRLRVLSMRSIAKMTSPRILVGIAIGCGKEWIQIFTMC